MREEAYPETMSNPAGDVEVKIPKLSKNSFFPELLEPRRRVERALSGGGGVMTAYVRGASTRKVDDYEKDLACESGVSKTTMSRIRVDIDREIAASGSTTPQPLRFPLRVPRRDLGQRSGEPEDRLL